MKIDENHENEVVYNVNNIGGLEIAFPDNSYKGAENFVNNAMNYVYIFSIIFGSIIVLYTILSSVNDRVREIGVLKSVGWSSNRVILMIIGESLFLCLISWMIGILFSYLVINYVISNFLSFEMILSPVMFLKALLILLCIGILGGFYPALKASSLSPSESLKYE